MSLTFADLRGKRSKERKERKQTEFHLHIAVVQYLRLQYPSLLFLHPANGMARTKAEGGKLKAMGVLAGAPDLLFWWGEHQQFSNTTLMRSGAIELKSSSGELQPNQITFKQVWEHFGGRWACCRSIEEVQTTLRAWGIKPA